MGKKETEWDCRYAGDYDRVDDGIYDATVIGYEKGNWHMRKKIYIWFRIIEVGRFQGKEIFMCCNMQDAIKKKSKYYNAWVKANNGVKPKKNSRMSARIFKGQVFSIKAVTVGTDRDKNTVAEDDKYSVVESIQGISVGQTRPRML